MTVDEVTLERVLRDRRFDERTVAIARRLFIDNIAPRALAKEFAVIDKRVYAIRAAVLKQASKYALPEGWSELTVQGPAHVVSEVQAVYAALMSKEDGLGDPPSEPLPPKS